MAIPRTWIGGGNNKAGNANDWSPTGRPHPGDTLSMNPGTTINNKDHDLAGNPLTYRSDDTINLSHHAHVTAQSAVITAPSDIARHVMFNRYRTDTLDISFGFEAGVTVNTAANSKWIGRLNAVQDTFTVNGAPGASFSNQSSTGTKVNALINANVTGKRTITAGDFSQWEVTKCVGAAQTLNLTDLSGKVQIDHPQGFHAKVVDDGLLKTPSQAHVDLLGLAKADSYL